jgi:ABC-type transport system involved in cytochrome c biogenesis permease subunit
MNWNHYIYFAVPAVICWSAAAYYAYKANGYRRAILLTVTGLCLFLAYILGLWLSLERPPMRTMGETRLWYSFFLPIAGLITYTRWRYNWILTLSTLLSFIFICINLLRPEIHNKALMPALQSPWFAPHVITYMFAYALLGAAAITALYLLTKPNKTINASVLTPCDNLIYVGTAFLTLGMLIGALWAKEAWGHYWTWDPKETWAAATWLSYLTYIHYRLHRPTRYNTALSLILFAFILLQICWFGINYLPTAKNASIHIYN